MKYVMTFAAALLATGPVLAADGAALYKEKTCTACHGADGKKTLMPDYPKIAGQNAKYIERQMLDIKSGARANGNSAAMKGVMEIVTEADIKALAAYIANMK
ncbi:MAG: c-type cytochrome [Azonexus sp.]|nr:c-type cytochrome [Betaproteobacteria bacterium]MBK8918217.1 c-type cytochrome [Betaproteobacteria bacterium]MBP6036233.1 c-type cytochrome [Azonexus sp.]MBP6906756.1 c-type cytochrome [Azonexus sp.]